eukprot:UN12309
MPQTVAGVFAILWLLVVVIKPTGTAKKIRNSEKNGYDGQCKRLNNAAFSGYPSSSSLSYCNQYRYKTCCNSTHTDNIKRKIYPYFELSDDVFPDACRTIGTKIGCSVCDPRVGTEELHGLCPDVCDEWYSACKNAFFYYSHNVLSPCPADGIVCSRLKTIVTNGHDLCNAAGYEINDTYGECFDLSQPKLPRSRPSPLTEQLSYVFRQIFRGRLRVWQDLPPLLKIGILAAVFYMFGRCVVATMQTFTSSTDV